jgi:hypothetical protein
MTRADVGETRMLTRETLDFLLALARYEVRALHAAMHLAPDDADVAALLVDIARHRATVIATLITDDRHGTGSIH